MKSTELGIELYELSQKLRHLKKRKPFNGQLNPADAGLMLFLSKHTDKENGIAACEISEKVHVTPSFITQQINRLETMGCVYKAINETDKRRVKVFLTEQGRALVEEECKKQMSGTIEIAEKLGEEDTKELIRLLEKICKGCDRC